MSAPPPGAAGRAARHGARRGADGATGQLPRRHWAAGGVPFRLSMPPVGVLLGLDSQGGSAVFPLLVPTHSTRVGIVGDPGVARLLALRLLAQSCDLTVVTHRPGPWVGLAAGVPDTPITVIDQVQRWPAAGVPAPWALLIDMPGAPPTGFARAPWSTVIHLVPAVPPGSGWWQSAQLVLTTRPFARSVLGLRPRLDAAIVDQLADDEVVAIDQSGVTVFRPAPTYHESLLLSRVG